MNRFLFITHITPVSKRTPLRQSLIDVYYNALLSQHYNQWKVLILGEGEIKDDRFVVVPLIDGSVDEKIDALRKIYKSPLVVDLINESDFIVKLDDDDVISPRVLQDLKDFDGDVYYDDHHTFYDLAGGRLGQQQRPWIASTCIHRRTCAFDHWEGEGAGPLKNVLYSDHSKAWHRYYQGKRKYTSKPENPVYLRVLSPTSITAGGNSKKVSSHIDIEWVRYGKYLSGFGNWDVQKMNDFQNYVEQLTRAWIQFAGETRVAPLPKKNLMQRIVNYIKRGE